MLERRKMAQQHVDLVEDRADLGELALQVLDGDTFAGVAPVLRDDAGAGADPQCGGAAADAGDLDRLTDVAGWAAPIPAELLGSSATMLMRPRPA